MALVWNPMYGAMTEDSAPAAPVQNMQQMYQDWSTGKTPITDFSQLLTTENLGIHPDEFRQLPANVQSAARANPQQFLQTVLANRNTANQDLLSAGAEGGYENYNTAKWIPGQGVAFDPNAYKSINDQSFWTQARDAVESAAVPVFAASKGLK